jgi:site-specific DNA-methyltransferase (adenine-specific)
MTCKIVVGDCLASLRAMADQSVNTCVTSPPYFGLRDYGHAGQIGLEQTPENLWEGIVGSAMTEADELIDMLCGD